MVVGSSQVALAAALTEQRLKDAEPYEYQWFRHIINKCPFLIFLMKMGGECPLVNVRNK